MAKDLSTKIVKLLWSEPFVIIGFVFFMLGDEDDNYWIIGLTFLVLGYYRLRNRLREFSVEDNSSQEETNELP